MEEATFEQTNERCDAVCFKILLFHAAANTMKTEICRASLSFEFSLKGKGEMML
jgi:ectoine hydroxylase-related dioxygenase (phytanoyl-CoA dioxygenase family)